MSLPRLLWLDPPRTTNARMSKGHQRSTVIMLLSAFLFPRLLYSNRRTGEHQPPYWWGPRSKSVIRFPWMVNNIPWIARPYPASLFFYASTIATSTTLLLNPCFLLGSICLSSGVLNVHFARPFPLAAVPYRPASCSLFWSTTVTTLLS